MNLKELGRKIKQQRTYKGLKQDQLSEDVGISVGFLGGIERGEKIASLKVMLAIANRLGSSLDYLLSDDINKIEEETRIDYYAEEFKYMINKLEDRELINDFITYCHALSDAMEKKKHSK